MISNLRMRRCQNTQLPSAPCRRYDPRDPVLEPYRPRPHHRRAVKTVAKRARVSQDEEASPQQVLYSTVLCQSLLPRLHPRRTAVVLSGSKALTYVRPSLGKAVTGKMCVTSVCYLRPFPAGGWFSGGVREVALDRVSDSCWSWVLRSRCRR